MQNGLILIRARIDYTQYLLYDFAHNGAFHLSGYRAQSICGCNSCILYVLPLSILHHIIHWGSFSQLK